MVSTARVRGLLFVDRLTTPRTWLQQDPRGSMLSLQTQALLDALLLRGLLHPAPRAGLCGDAEGLAQEGRHGVVLSPPPFKGSKRPRSSLPRSQRSWFTARTSRAIWCGRSTGISPRGTRCAPDRRRAVWFTSDRNIRFVGLRVEQLSRLALFQMFVILLHVPLRLGYSSTRLALT